MQSAQTLKKIKFTSDAEKTFDIQPDNIKTNKNDKINDQTSFKTRWVQHQKTTINTHAKKLWFEAQFANCKTLIQLLGSLM